MPNTKSYSTEQVTKIKEDSKRLLSRTREVAKARADKLKRTLAELKGTVKALKQEVKETKKQNGGSKRASASPLASAPQSRRSFPR